MNGYTNYVDLDRIKGTTETLHSLDNCLNNKDLSENFQEIEEIIKKVNFEHDDCIKNYKEPISYIMDELLGIKKEVFELDSALEKTIVDFTKEEEKTVQDIRELSTYFGGKEESKIEKLLREITEYKVEPNSNGVTDSIAEVIADGTEIAGKQEINTVPIGIGIGATGIAASVGAVLVDSAKHNKKDTLEYYKPNKEEQDEYIPRSIQQHRDINDWNIIDDKTPYNALRDKEIKSKFYNQDDNSKDEEKY